MPGQLQSARSPHVGYVDASGCNSLLKHQPFKVGDWRIASSGGCDS